MTMPQFVRSSWLTLICVCVSASGAQAAGRATADFPNAQPDKSETAWGRLVADAVRSAGHADISLVNAGALKRGVLHAGPVTAATVDALLSFGDDEVVTLRISGEQLRAALERAAQAYPDASPAFLQCSGITAAFNSQSPKDRRLTMVRFHGREVDNHDAFAVAMPVSLAQGSAGFFTIWKPDGAAHSGSSLRSAVLDYAGAHGQIAPDPATRFAAQ